MSSKPLPRRAKDLPPIDFDSDSSTHTDGKSITQILRTIEANKDETGKPTPPEAGEVSETIGGNHEETVPCIATPVAKKDEGKEEKVILSVRRMKENNRNLANLNINCEQKSSSEFSKRSTVEMKAPSDAPIKVPEEKSYKIVKINGKDYSVKRKLGQGGSSVVYLAHMMDRNMECALKVVRLSGNQDALSDNINEIELLKRLQGNYIVTLFDHFYSPDDSILYIAMEKGEQDLNAILKEFEQNLPVYKIMDFWYQMLKCVQYIHSCGVIHCDIKPANFLMVNRKLKLIDFGIASNISLDSTSIIKHTQAGTYNYISPETLIDISTDEDTRQDVPKIKISPKTDVWSLGCIFFQLLYKTTPFGHIKIIPNKIMAICNPNTAINYPPLPSYYPPMFLEIAQKCLKHNPKERSSIKELLNYPFELFLPMQ
ncbi:dual specificity protein kinase TTK [Lutzomyia longipalpis]|uniref:dual specificity protein kinase TTK n=1 Tax=Lutzomyia longipalpis TaxID=7200 RepID=UPI0024834C4E|nr:dual specificity protein kinase TTK [Lutzomyia longipalpis]